MLYGMADDRDETGYEMTEEDELSMFDMCERVGRSMARCISDGRDGCFGPCDRLIACKCAGTGVEPETLSALYALARDVADLASDRAFEDGQRDVAEGIQFTSWCMSGESN